MTITINGTTGVTYPAGGTDNVAGSGVGTTDTQTLTNKTLTNPVITGGTVPATSGPDSTQLAGNRNKIINGAMMIDQRNAGAAVSLTTPATYVIDRWSFRSNTSITVQRSITSTTGFINSAYITVPTGAASAAGNFNIMQQSVEGFNISDLGWGASGAKSVILSFQVRSSQTGTFAGSIRNGAGDRSYVFTYSIASANTWTSISLTISGDTTGTWSTDNSAGLIVTFDLGSGSTFATTSGSWTAGNYVTTSGAVQLTTTSGATWYVTGVQLEKGATATPFENRLYGTELALCQRYYSTFYIAFDAAGNTYAAQGITFPVPMRAMPTYTAITASIVAGNITSTAFNVGNFPAGQPTTGTTVQWGMNSTARAYYFGDFSAAAEL